MAERIQRQETIHPIEELESAGEAQESPALCECDRRKQIERKTKTLYCLWEQSESEQMAFRCPTAKVVGKSELKDYELLFRGGRRGLRQP